MIILCMFAGVLIGKFLSGISEFLERFEYANVSIPMAILIWLMIYPIMLKRGSINTVIYILIEQLISTVQ